MRRAVGRKILAAVTLVAALVLPAGPAFAQTGCDIRLGGVSNGQSISGGVNLRATGSSGMGLRRLELSINGGVVKAASYDGLQQNASIDYGWNPSGGRNGEYTVKAAGDCAGGASNSQTAKVYVDNAPQAPSGVSAYYADGAIYISWNANPEPDIQGYRVERDGGSGWQNAGQVGSTSFSDNPGSGTFSYRVIALRFSPTQGTKASAPSGSASATVPAAAPDPGTTDGEVGSGDGSGTGSGSDSGTGGSGSGSGGGKNGGFLPGYGGNDGKGGGSGKGSNGGPGSVSGYGGGFFGGRNIGGIGLPGSLRLPGNGRANVPGESAAVEGDGTYEEFLPYELGGPGAAGPKTSLESFGTAALSPFRVIPPDAARWVAAGLWFLVTAALLKFLERKVAQREAAEALQATDATVTELPIAEAEGTAPATEETATASAPHVAATPSRTKCTATTKAGNPCRNYAVDGGERCRMHAAHESPATAEHQADTGLRLVKEGDAA
jgi:hypothetical protein